MQEIQIKNSQGIKVYIDEFPKTELIPKAEMDLLVSELEKYICDKIKQKRSRKRKK